MLQHHESIYQPLQPSAWETGHGSQDAWTFLLRPFVLDNLYTSNYYSVLKSESRIEFYPHFLYSFFFTKTSVSVVLYCPRCELDKCIKEHPPKRRFRLFFNISHFVIHVEHLWYKWFTSMALEATYGGFSSFILVLTLGTIHL